MKSKLMNSMSKVFRFLFEREAKVLMWHLIAIFLLFTAVIVSSVITKYEQDEQIEKLQKERDAALDQHWNNAQERMKEADR